MPIYEFRCLKCQELSEFLFTATDDQAEIKCKHCGSEELDRVLSVSGFAVKPGPGSSSVHSSSSTKKCSTGSCSTLEIPGLGD